MRKRIAATALVGALGLAGGAVLAPAGASNHSADPGPSGRHGGLVGAELVAELLGMTTEELRAARQDGSSLANIAKAQGVAEPELVRGLVDAAADRLDEAVADGRLTREQADRREARLEQRIAKLVTRSGARGHGPGHHLLGPVDPPGSSSD